MVANHYGKALHVGLGVIVAPLAHKQTIGVGDLRCLSGLSLLHLVEITNPPVLDRQ
jgi:hypothetical protein